MIMYFSPFVHYLQCPLAEVTQIQNNSLLTVQREEGKRLLLHFLIRIFVGNAFHAANGSHDFLNFT